MKKFLTLVSMIALAGCSNGFKVQSHFDPASTDRVTYFEHAMAVSSNSAIYTHIATIAPHTLNGNVLRATGFAHEGIDYAYIVYNTEGNDVRGGLDVIKRNSSNVPVLIASIVSEGSEYAEVQVKNHYLYMVGQKTGALHNYGLLTVVNVTNPAAPVAVSELTFTDGYYATSIDIEGSKAYITVPNVGIKVVDISNPLTPTIVSTTGLGGNSLFVRRQSGSSVVLGGSGSHKVTQVADTGSVVSTLYTISSSVEQEAPSRFILSGNAFLSNAGNTGLTILDKVNTATPVLKSSTPITGRGNGITVGGCDTTYLAQGEQGLLTYNIANLTAPVLQGRFDYADDQEDRGSANNVFYMNYSNGNYVFVADGLGGVKIVQVTYNPAVCSAQTDVHNSEDHSGLLCKVYSLPTSTTALPNFSTLTPVGSFTTDILNVVNQTYANSFPLFPAGLKSMKEYYGVVCNGYWTSTKTEAVTFNLNSDDGSKLYVDGTMVINNDGNHGATSKTAVVNATPKEYAIKIEYYQGPQSSIALELKKKAASDTAESYVTGFSH